MPKLVRYYFRTAKASERTESNFYFVLIILTNGVLKNVRDTIDTLVEASSLPISVIFATLGNRTHPAKTGSKFDTLLSPSIKSFSNCGLAREIATGLSAAQDEAPSQPHVSNQIGQKMFSALSRQVSLHLCRN